MLAGLLRTIRALAGVTNVRGCHLTKVLRRHLTKVLRHLTKGCHLTKVLRCYLTNVAEQLHNDTEEWRSGRRRYAARGARSEPTRRKGRAHRWGYPVFVSFDRRN